MSPALWDVTRLSDERTWSVGRRCGDLAGVLAVVLAALGLSRMPVPQEWIAPEQLEIVLAVASGAISVAVGVLWLIVRRLTNDGRASWTSAAFAVYGMVAVPAMALGAQVEPAHVYTGATRVAANAVVTVLLLVATLPAVRNVRVQCPPLSIVGMGMALLAGALAELDPAGAVAVTGSAPVRLTIVAGWAVAGMAIAWQALSLGVSPGFRVGLGLVVLSVAHGIQIGHGGPAQQFAVAGQAFSFLRLAAILIVLLGTIQFASRSLRGIRQAQWEREEELRLAQHKLARSAESDHEIRNGIAGLAGATRVLQGSFDESGNAQMAAQLSRLDTLLSSPVDPNDDSRGAIDA